MAARRVENSIVTILDEALTRLTLVQRNLEKSKLRDDNVQVDILPSYWTNLKARIQIISRDATCFSLAFSRLPYPSDAETKLLVERSCNGAEQLVLAFNILPKKCGMLLWAKCFQVILDIVKSLTALFASTKSVAENGKKALQDTGNVWEQCDKAEVMPQSNKAAFIEVLQIAANLVDDALSELQTDVRNASVASSSSFDEEEGNGDGAAATAVSDVTSAQKKEAVDVCLNMIKAVKATLKKIRLVVDARIVHTDVHDPDAEDAPLNFKHICELDSLAPLIECLSPVIDDVVTSVCYEAESSKQTLLSQLRKLESAGLQLLLAFRQSSFFVANEDLERVNFLETAIKHNMNKLNISLGL